MILKKELTQLNIDYNILFVELKSKYWNELYKAIKLESVGGKYDLTKWLLVQNAIVYIITLKMLVDESQTWDYWKEYLNYEEIKTCYLKHNINLDHLISLIE